jgi:hypothetical protein
LASAGTRLLGLGREGQRERTSTDKLRIYPRVGGRGDVLRNQSDKRRGSCQTMCLLALVINSCHVGTSSLGSMEISTMAFMRDAPGKPCFISAQFLDASES